MDCGECSRYDCRSPISSYLSKSKSGRKKNLHHHSRKRSRSSSSDSGCRQRSHYHHKQISYSSSDDDSDCQVSINKRIFEEMKEVKKYYEKSNKYLQRLKLEKALDSINHAIKMCEGVLENHKILSKLYSRRGTIISLLKKPRYSFKAFLDFERGYMIDKNNKESKINMSQYFFVAANKFFKKEEYDAALTYTKHALRLYSGNTKASMLTQKIHLIKEAMNQQTGNKDRKFALDLSSKKDKKLKVKSFSPRILKAKEDEITSLYKLMDTALRVKNYPRAIIYINLALGQVKDLEADNKYRDLFELKERIKKLIQGTRESCIF